MLRTAATALLLVAAMLAACSSAASTDRASLADSYWNVLQIVRDGESVPIDVDRRPTLRLSAGLDRFSGHSGCNGFSGTLIVGDGSIEFTDAIVTLIGCDRVAQQEEALFDVLERADSHELVDLLVIRDDRGNTATLGNAHAAAIAESSIASGTWSG